MATTSPSPIESIVQCLAKAVESAKGLDASRSQNLRFALAIANSEAGRAAKIMRKAQAAKKPAKAANKPEKAARAVTPAKQSKNQSRRKSATLNGAVAH